MFRILQSIAWFYVNGFTRAAFVNLEKTPRDNDLLTMFVIGLIIRSRQSFTSHVGIGSSAQKALDDLYSNCLISVSVKDSNIYIMEMQALLPMAHPVIRCWNGTHYVYLIFVDRRSY